MRNSGVKEIEINGAKTEKLEIRKVQGTVVDEKGNPVSEADISSTWKSDKGTMTTVNGFVAEKDGKFFDFIIAPTAEFKAYFIAMNKDRKRVGIVEINQDNAGGDLKIKLGAPVMLCGEYECKELDKKNRQYNYMDISWNRQNKKIRSKLQR